MQDFKVSVVIPVYNAEDYISNAVESALDQPEVAEVVLVEDGSPDNALAVCKELEEKYQRVKLYQHPNGENRGAGASRNLGIKKSSFPFIAFLDADDWYLENRFKKTKEVFENHPDADGVYGALGTYFEDKAAKEKWAEYRDSDRTVPKANIAPDDLFLNFLLDASGHFQTDGITVKKDIFNKTGLFDPELKISQDTHMWLRMAAVTRLYPGNLENPVSMRRVHKGNRWTTDNKRRMYFARLYWRKLDKWAEEKSLSLRKRGAIRCARLIYESKGDNPKFNFQAIPLFLKNLFLSFLKEPRITLWVIPAFARRVKAEIKKI